MIVEATKALANHPGIAYAKAAAKRRVKFKDLPETHQKAIMMYMIEGAWGLDPRNPQDIKKAIKLYGNKPFFMGELAIDDELKKAIMSSNEFAHKTFDDWVKWYAKNDTDETKATYNEDWPVILNQPSYVPDYGLFEDGWHRFNYHYLAKKKKKVPFIQYIAGVQYFEESEGPASFCVEAAKQEHRTKKEMSQLAMRFMLELEKRHPHVSVSSIEPHYDLKREDPWVPETIHVGLVEVDEGEQGKGYYKAWKRDLHAMADAHGVTIVTYPTHEYGSTKKRLVALNRSFGYTGPSKDGCMTRRPQKQVNEAAIFSKHAPVNTGGRIIPRKLSGTVYHGSSCDSQDGWFDTLNVDDEAAAVWVTPEEAMARRFGQGRSKAKLVFVNKYKLKGMKAAELDQKAYDRISSRENFDSDGRDMRYALADYLSGKGYHAWLTTGSISGQAYEDIAIFSGFESEAEYEGTSFRMKDGSWGEYEYFYDEDEVQEYLKQHSLL